MNHVQLIFGTSQCRLSRVVGNSKSSNTNCQSTFLNAYHAIKVRFRKLNFKGIMKDDFKFEGIIKDDFFKQKILCKIFDNKFSEAQALFSNHLSNWSQAQARSEIYFSLSFSLLENDFQRRGFAEFLANNYETSWAYFVRAEEGVWSFECGSKIS